MKTFVCRELLFDFSMVRKDLASRLSTITNLQSFVVDHRESLYILALCSVIRVISRALALSEVSEAVNASF